MSLLKNISKALQYIFKGPSGNVPRKIKKSTSQIRFKSAPGKIKKEIAPEKEPKRKSKPSPKKTAPKRKNKAPILEKDVEPKAKVKAAAKPAKPSKTIKEKVSKPPRPEFFVGDITHFFPKISVVVVKVVDHPILVGDEIHIKGSSDFTQKAESLQVESKDVRFARRGELVGLKTIQPAKPGDKVYKFKGK